MSFPAVPRKTLSGDIYRQSHADFVKYAGAVSGDEEGAEDIVQDAWIRLEQMAVQQKIERPVHLLWRILRNLSIDRSRRLAHERRYRQVNINQDIIEAAPDMAKGPEQTLLLRDDIRVLETALSQLDARTRRAFEMHRFEEARLRDIAAALGVSVTTAHSLVANALRHCRQHLRDANGAGYGFDESL